MKDKFKDPLDLDFKETTKNVVKGAIILGLGIPLVLGATELIN